MKKLLLAFVLAASSAFAQQVSIQGIVLSRSESIPLKYAFVINYRTQNGTFCDQDGHFSLIAEIKDSLLISQTGFKPIKVFLADSMGKNPINLKIYLEVKPVQLPKFTVKAPKTYDQIIQELEEAEKSAQRKEMPLADAVSSPITFLYQQFSKAERSKQKIASLRKEKTQTELLRDLFTRYMLAQIINLQENEMDAFIAYSNLSNIYTQFESEYDLVVYVKERFSSFRRSGGVR